MPTIFYRLQIYKFFLSTLCFQSVFTGESLIFVNYMDTVRQQYIAINKRIFNQRDGELREIQQEYGAIYKKSLGVPIVSLQNIASDYECSHELAKLLWAFGGREQTLLAAMLDEPEKLTKTQLESYLCHTHTPELWEQITRQLLRRLPHAKDCIESWLAQQDETLHIFAVLALGHLPELFSDKILQSVMNLPVKESSYLQKCLRRVLLKVGIKNKPAYQLMKQHLKMHSCYPSLLEEIANFYT